MMRDDTVTGSRRLAPRMLLIDGQIYLSPLSAFWDDEVVDVDAVDDEARGN